MNGFWKKKLPALLLALVMVAGMVPTALAADCGHNNWGSWTKLNDSQHQRTCLTSGCSGTQEANHTWAAAYETDRSNHWKKCTECGAQTVHTAHTYSGTMKYDASNHWDQCTVCGYKDNLGGHVDLNNDGKCDTCSYSTGTATVTVTFMNGTKIYKTQSVKKGSAPSAPGTPTKASSGSKTYTFKGWTTKDPGSSAVYNGQSYLTASEVTRTALSANTTYYALYTEGSGTTISWKVKPGNELKFDRSDFKDLFDDEYDGDDEFRYVTFEADSSLKTSNGVLYSGQGTSDEKAFTRSDLEDYDFYYSKSKYGDYSLESLSFVAGNDAKGKTVTLDFTLYGDDEELEGTLEIEITTSTSSKSDADIVYKVEEGEDVAFNRADFRELFDDEYDNDTFRYVVFSPNSSYKSANGYLYYDYDGKDEEKFTRADLEDYEFYYSSSKYGDYPIDDLSFVAGDDADGETVTLDFTLYGDNEELEASLEILIGDVDEDDEGDINYTVKPGGEVEFDRSDFNNYFKEEYSGSVRWVTFYPDSSYTSANGAVYYKYGSKSEEEFSRTELKEAKFYYSDDEYGDYALNDLSFVADDDFTGSLTLEFRAWYSEDKYVEGDLVISSDEKSASVIATSSVRYYTTGSNAVQINANDIARAYAKQYPGSTLQSVELLSVPTTGGLYYDYYGSGRTQLTSQNCRNQLFYHSPSGSQYDLNRLTYIPSGSNYCGYTLYTAKGTGGSVLGTILISATKSAVGEVYGITPKNTAVMMPASSIFNAIYTATGTTLASIQLLELPAATVGTVTVSNGYLSMKADTSTKYAYSGSTNAMSQLKFTPAANYTGSMELPYMAYDKAGNAIAAGKFCLGVLNNRKNFSDVASSNWCYKYVVELSDANVINGYPDGSFQPSKTTTYGEALKLIMLAAGYPEQAPTDKNSFASGYLAKAQADGLVSGSVDLNKPITRLQVAQLAAKALRLNISNLSSVKPFTDTSDVYVQALNAAGIVEGYFAGGTYTFRPNNPLTRGEVSTIVWRMRNYNK